MIWLTSKLFREKLLIYGFFDRTVLIVLLLSLKFSSIEISYQYSVFEEDMLLWWSEILSSLSFTSITSPYLSSSIRPRLASAY